jgi:membrane dipeptidase
MAFSRHGIAAAAALALALVPAGCGVASSTPRTGASLSARAERLAREVLIVDTHIDLPERLKDKMEDVCGSTPDGNFDYPRAKAGGLKAPFMAIYVGADIEDPSKARQEADRLIDLVEGIAARCPDKFALARSPEEVRRIVASGRIALPMGLENGSPIGDDPGSLEHFRQRGIAYVTLTHSANNGLADSSFAAGRKWHGLSPFGKKVITEMNRIGIMVDVSHLSDEAARQAIELSKVPVIASHSSCRKFTPGFERNLADPEIRSIAKKGGVVQINFGSMFLRDDARRQSSEAWREIRKYLGEHKLERASDEAKRFRERYRKEHPPVFGDVSDVVAHIDHVVKIAGVDHVGLGSDFEGVGESLPDGLKDVSGYPRLIRALLEKGYSDQDIRKICGENLLRVWSEVERAAAGGR